MNNRSRYHLALDVPALILVLGLAFAGWIVWEMKRLAFDSTLTTALTYPALIDELNTGLVDQPGRMLRESMTANEAVRVMAAKNGARTALYDTLVVVDSTSQPALKRGGFIADEIQKYNAIQRKRLELLETWAEPTARVVDFRSSDNPSVFRTNLLNIPDDLGGRDSVVIRERAVASGLRIASPFEATRTVAVTTRNASKHFAFVSQAGTAMLEGVGMLPGLAGCPFKTRNREISIQCLGPGSPFDESVLRFASPTEETGSITRVGGGDVHYDGQEISRGVSTPVGTGGVFLFPTARQKETSDPVILERALAGVLAGTQWINGRIQWRVNPEHSSPFFQQLAGPGGFVNVSATTPARVISLSLDDKYTKDLQRALEVFVERRGISQALTFATVVTANAKTGEVLGVAEVGRADPDGRSWLTHPLNVGSAIKPILAAAVLLKFPELATLEIHSPGGSVRELWGLPLATAFETGCAPGWIDLKLFLQCSSNLYSASLVAAALQRPGQLNWTQAALPTFRFGGITRNGRPRMPLRADGSIEADSFHASGLASGLAQLDSIPTSIEYATAKGGRDPGIWTGLSDSRRQPVAVPFGLWPENSRVGLVYRGSPASLRLLAALAIGAGENRMTTLKLTEAFARIVTDRRVTLSFVTAPAPIPLEELGMAVQPWYGRLVEGLNGVGGLGGTGNGINDDVHQIIGPSYVFYGKTGTLNSRPRAIRRQRTDTLLINSDPTVFNSIAVDSVPPVVVKSLLYAVGQTSGPARPLKCGVVGTVYFRFNTNPAGNVEGHATQFFRTELLRVINAHQARLQLCP